MCSPFFVEHFGLEMRESDGCCTLASQSRSTAGMNCGAQPLRVDRERDHAGHALARRAFEAQLRLHVVRPAVDRLGEGDDGAAAS